jgi:hypothetical protein
VTETDVLLQSVVAGQSSFVSVVLVCRVCSECMSVLLGGVFEAFSSQQCHVVVVQYLTAAVLTTCEIISNF